MKQLIAAFLCLILPMSAAAHGVKQNFHVQIGLFDAADLTLEYDLTGDSFKMRSVAETAGLFGQLYAYRATFETNGLIKNGIFTADGYTYRSETKRHTRTKRLYFDKSGRLSKRTSSKDGVTKSTVPETPALKPDAYDLQTVFAQLIDRYDKTGFCADEKIVFNGKRLYRVTLTDDGTAEIAPKENIFYHGTAWRCALNIKEIQNDDADLLWQTAAKQPILLYIARNLQNDRPFLARIEIESTPLGRLLADTTNLEWKDENK
jgi:hypothetical protein